MRLVITVEVVRDDGTRETVDLGCVERTSPTAATDVGLTLAETKPLVARSQQQMSGRVTNLGVGALPG